MPRVNPQILEWARESAEIPPDLAARKLAFKDSKNGTASEKLLSLESGEKEPTQPQLVKMAALYKRPLITFYLEQPPVVSDKGGDFRRLPEGYSREENARVDALLRDVKARQEMVKGLLEDEDEAVSLDFVGSMSMRDSVDTLVVSIREKLGVSVGNLRECRNPDDAFKYLRSKAEGLGIFVLLIGDLGSFHSAISTEVFRGFALADNMAPFIVINDKDSKAAWSFTLMHELVHLWLGETGVSNVSSEASVERFCNDVAGEFLLPRSEIMHVPVSQDMQIAQLISVITDFSTQTNLSKTLVAYNLLKARKINRGQYNALSSTFRRFWREDRRASSGESGTPDYFVVRRHRMGPALISLVRRMIQDGAVTPTKAATILGVNPHAVGKVVGV